MGGAVLHLYSAQSQNIEFECNLKVIISDSDWLDWQENPLGGNSRMLYGSAAVRVFTTHPSPS